MAGGHSYFHLIPHPHNTITAREWQRALSKLRFELAHRIRDAHHVFPIDGPVAFRYTDPHCHWRGSPAAGVPSHPKSFRLYWEWDEQQQQQQQQQQHAIQSHLGGRRRSDWSNVAWVCQFLCDEFPRQLALVVSEGMSQDDHDEKKPGTTRYCYYSEGAVLYYEGTGCWKEMNYRKWPWINHVAR